LNQKHHQKSAKRGGRVDDELPGVGVVEVWSGKAPNDNACYGQEECPRGPDCLCGPVRELPEVFFHGDTIIAHGQARNRLAGKNQCVTGS
jgi:hypothetical protein